MEPTTRAWPDWLKGIDPDMERLLAAIDKHRGALEDACRDGHVYRRLGRAQIRQFEDFVEQHRGFRAVGGRRAVNFEVLKKIQVPQAVLRAAVHNISQRHQELAACIFGRKVVILKMVEAMTDSLGLGNLFSAFAAMRVLLENLGAISLLVERLSEVKIPADAHEAGILLDDIINREFATQIDWTKVAQSDLRQVEDPQQLRKAGAPGQTAAREVREWLLSLGKRINGVLSVYEVLSEATTPRFGSLWLVYEDSKSMPDRAKTVWNRNKMGTGLPGTMTREMPGTIVQIFGILNGALGIIGQIDREFRDIDARMSAATRDETRTWLWMFPDLFDKHEDCPCGSGKRVKYCCGS